LVDVCPLVVYGLFVWLRLDDVYTFTPVTVTRLVTVYVVVAPVVGGCCICCLRVWLLQFAVTLVGWLLRYVYVWVVARCWLFGCCVVPRCCCLVALRLDLACGHSPPGLLCWTVTLRLVGGRWFVVVGWLALRWLLVGWWLRLRYFVWWLHCCALLRLRYVWLRLVGYVVVGYVVFVCYVARLFIVVGFVVVVVVVGYTFIYVVVGCVGLLLLRVGRWCCWFTTLVWLGWLFWVVVGYGYRLVGLVVDLRWLDLLLLLFGLVGCFWLVYVCCCLLVIWLFGWLRLFGCCWLLFDPLYVRLFVVVGYWFCWFVVGLFTLFGLVTFGYCWFVGWFTWLALLALLVTRLARCTRLHVYGCFGLLFWRLLLRLRWLVGLVVVIVSGWTCGCWLVVTLPRLVGFTLFDGYVWLLRLVVIYLLRCTRFGCCITVYVVC